MHTTIQTQIWTDKNRLAYFENLNDIEYSTDQQRSGDIWDKLDYMEYSTIVQRVHCHLITSTPNIDIS